MMGKRWRRVINTDYHLTKPCKHDHKGPMELIEKPGTYTNKDLGQNLSVRWRVLRNWTDLVSRL